MSAKTSAAVLLTIGKASVEAVLTIVRSFYLLSAESNKEREVAVS